MGDGHTHAGDVFVVPIDGKDYSSANQFSPQDISIYKNTLTETGGKKVDSGYGKPVVGYVATPDGGLREYSPGVSNSSNSGKVDAGGVPIKNYDVPVAKDFPSDPASKGLRLNNIPPTTMPNVLPNGFSLNDYTKRY
ncbi:hypothetical protein F3J23_07475 [Chryseobacterium sp. Tr-659]|uniref:hypothetical protein n=1 Tax=Chryseobacterium sp. Tr-659 TaxID=2608340 RepID=UPI00397766E5|nr:hypothetical protein [Chryseobacterium sp. Tr-659]